MLAGVIWRDFYYQLGYYFPHVLTSPLKPKYSKIRWNNNKTELNSWKMGKTGFPIVDACMRELNTTGYMHNRGRLIVGSFLVKVLLHNWQEGEKYFAQKLEDYDPLVNNGNWQWVSGSGADSQPYFRIFNPWEQSKKYDPNGTFIKKWLPELENIPSNELHKWYKYYKKYENKLSYPNPIVDYVKEKKKVLNAYKKIFTTTSKISK